MGNIVSFVKLDLAIDQHILGHKFRFIKPVSEKKKEEGYENYYEPWQAFEDPEDPYLEMRKEGSLVNNFEMLQKLRYQIIDNAAVYHTRGHTQSYVMGLISAVSLLLGWKTNGCKSLGFIMYGILTFPAVIGRSIEYRYYEKEFSFLQRLIRMKITHMEDCFITYKNLQLEPVKNKFHRIDENALKEAQEKCAFNYASEQEFAIKSLTDIIEQCNRFTVHTTVERCNFIRNNLVRTLPRSLPKGQTEFTRVLPSESEESLPLIIQKIRTCRVSEE